MDEHDVSNADILQEMSHDAGLSESMCESADGKRYHRQRYYAARAGMEALLELERTRQWPDAPDGDGLYWVHVRDGQKPRLVDVYEDGEGVTMVFDHVAGQRYMLVVYPARLWSRLPGPPPVPTEEARGD